MNSDLALLPAPVRRTVVHDDGSQTWTTTWTLTVTRAPAPALHAQPTEPVVVTSLPFAPADVAAPPARALPPALPSRREVRGRAGSLAVPGASPRPDAAPAPARRPAPARAPRQPAPAFLRVSLGVAVGVGIVVAGIRAHALDDLGLHPTDNDSVAAAVTRLVDHATGN